MQEELTIRTNGQAERGRRADCAIVEIQLKNVSTVDGDATNIALSSTKELQELALTHARGSSAAISDWDMIPVATTKKLDPNPSSPRVAYPRVDNYIYTATATFRITFRSMQVLGEVVGTPKALPGSITVTTTWSFSDALLTELETETRKAAMKDAITRAEDFAEAAIGYRNLRVGSIDDLDPSRVGNMDGIGGDGSFIGLNVPTTQEKRGLEPGEMRLT